MFALQIILRGREAPVTLFFKSWKTAIEVYPSHFIDGVTDDFGSKFALMPDDIAGLFVSDIAAASKAQVEISLIQARAQADAQRAAQKDIRINGLGNAVGVTGLIS